jgi:hypothetical protein
VPALEHLLDAIHLGQEAQVEHADRHQPLQLLARLALATCRQRSEARPSVSSSQTGTRQALGSNS